MNTATIIKSPQEVIKNIQDYDRNILIDALITSPKDLQETMNFLESQKNLPGVNMDTINNLKNDCMQIMMEKIKLTKIVLGVNGNTNSIIPNPSIEIKEEVKEVKESKSSSPKYQGKVINADFNKGREKQETKKNQASKPIENLEKGTIGEFKDEKQETILTPNSTSHVVVQPTPVEKEEVVGATSTPSYFQGYERKVIFGTDTEIPESVFHLVPLAESESDIDTIARHLINEDKVELALNLSIDLFEKSKTSPKTQQEVENRFLFEILPWAHGVQVDTKTDMQNISLSMWNDQIKQKALSEIKEVIETTKDSTVGLTYETLVNECISKFKAKESFKDVKKFFDKELVNVTDTIDKSDKGLFAKIVIEFKKTEKTVETAETAAYEGKEELTAEQVKTKGKSIIKSALELGKSAMNEFRKYLSQKDIRKALGSNKVEAEKLFTELKSEIEAENPSLKKVSKVKVMLGKNFSVEEKHPDVYESAKLCKNLSDFRNLIISIVFDKNKELPNGWQVAANLSNQYLNNIEESKSWDDVKKLDYFKEVITSTTEQRKKEKAKDAVVTDAVIVEEIKNPETTAVIETKAPEQTVETPSEQEKVEIARTEESSTSSINLEKYKKISEEKNNNKIHELMASFLLETNYKTYPERVAELDTYLVGNKKWARAPKADRDNVINKVVKNNPKIQELLK